MTTSHTVNANGLRIHYVRLAADKPQLLLLHGLTDNGRCWTPVIEALAGEYDIIAPDARGHGLSDAPERGYSAADHVADAAAFIQALGLKRPAVLGHSMGGAEATLLAATYPELVRAIAVEDPAWFDPNPAQTPDMRQAAAAEWRKGLVDKHAKDDQKMIADQRVEQPSWAEAEFAPWAEAKRQARPQVTDYVAEERFDWRSAVKAIQCPVLLITSDVARGAIISPAQAQAAVALNPRVRVANIPGTGHSIRRENLEAYMKAVREFLAETAM
jgi:pimeloyl-ACP methyl ester carboxylesterase